MPAPPPATRFVAAEAGFLPPGPFVDFADMIVSNTNVVAANKDRSLFP